MKQFSIKAKKWKTGKQENRDEKGVALILTLGILSFLLVLALGFASSAITQKKAAANSASVALSRILAESAAEKCLAGLAYYTDNVSNAAFDVIFSNETNDPNGNDKTFDQLHRITTTQKDITYFKWDSPSYDKDDADAIHWQYVYNGEDSTKNQRIIGRYAYVVIPSGGKLNPGYCVSHKNTYPDGTARDESSANEPRVGKNVNEIRIGKIYSSIPGTYMTLDDLKSLSTNVVGGSLTDGGDWVDTSSMISAVIGAGNETKKMYWNEWFAVNNTADKEQFWIDVNNNKLQDEDEDEDEDDDEFYHRFNIARTDWDAGTNADKIKFMNDYILKDPSKWRAEDSDGDGIPWLKYWGENSGNWPDAATKAKQIAANLIDYCDNDSEALRDNDLNPTYTGNDKTPYINEIGINIECTTQVTAIAGPPAERKFSYNIQVVLGGERVDMYSDLAADAVLSIVEGELRFKYKKSDGTNSAEQTVNLAGMSVTIPQSSSPGYNMVFGGGAGVKAVAPIIDQSGNSTNAGIVDVKVQIKRAKLEYDGKFADFVKPDYDGGWSQEIASMSTRDTDGGPTTEQGYFSYQIDDPRQNLNDADWDQATGQKAANYDLAGGTQGTINTAKVTCTTSGDAEASSTPTNLSTAYIRNAQMESPWELGFIHRAAKWETINLKAYNSDDDDDGTVAAGELGVSSGFGGRAYAKGDANILDQIKMHKTFSIHGKFNIRAPHNLDVLRALLGGIYVGTNDISAWSGGSELTYTSATSGQVPDLANAILGSSERPFLTRAMVAKVSALSDASIVSAQDTDAKKEEIIGKFINLTKTEIADEFTIIVIAQAIKDIGGGVTIYKDLNYDGDVTDTNLQGTSGDPGYFVDETGPTSSDLPDLNETITNCKYGVYDLGADEILAEQKIMVKVKYNSSLPVGQRWYITRYEYIGD